MAFVRILSVLGTKLSGDLSADDQRERIRVAILTQNVRDKRNDFGKGIETFAQAYERCYHRSLDLRRVPRTADGRPAGLMMLDDDDEEIE
jgi:hypothetical protein